MKTMIFLGLVFLATINQSIATPLSSSCNRSEFMNLRNRFNLNGKTRVTKINLQFIYERPEFEGISDQWDCKVMRTKNKSRSRQVYENGKIQFMKFMDQISNQEVKNIVFEDGLKVVFLSEAGKISYDQTKATPELRVPWFTDSKKLLSWCIKQGLCHNPTETLGKAQKAMENIENTLNQSSTRNCK